MPNPALFSALLAVFTLACSYELPLPPGAGEGGGGAAAAYAMTTDPPADLDAVPAVLRLKITGPPGASMSRVGMVSGEVSPQILRELEMDDISNALSERVVPVLSWADDDGTLEVAPTVALAAGEIYSVALEDEAIALSFTVATTPPAVLPRIWPPAGAAASATIGVWCGDHPIEGVHPAAIALEPIDVAGQMVSGVAGVDARCVTFEVKATPKSSDPAVAVPAVPGLDPPLGLDPRPFAHEAEPRPVEALACAATELTFGAGCASVEDDRLVGRSPAAPALWAVHGAGVDRVLTTAASDPFVLTGLAPSSDVHLDVTVIDNAGRAARSTFDAWTRPAMAHVILNEVLADPIGPEPSEEWVELYNDGSVTADLAGLVFVDLGGETPLPDAKLPPHAFALLVGADYVADDGFDPKPPASVLLLRVPRVGKSGLTNAGEPLALRNSRGTVLSQFPPLPKPKSGLSVSRVSPSAPDGLPSSFVLTAPTPGAPNGPAAP